MVLYVLYIYRRIFNKIYHIAGQSATDLHSVFWLCLYLKSNSLLFIEVVWRSCIHLAIWYPIHVHLWEINVQLEAELKSAGCVRKQLQTLISHHKMETPYHLQILSANIAWQRSIKTLVCDMQYASILYL